MLKEMNPLLPQQLARRLELPLPGREAQARFEPELACGRHFDRPAADAREAAVTLLLYPRAGAWHLPLLLRPANLALHAGQVGLPGGRLEAGETPRQAALRELEEELGVPPGDVEVLGRLSSLYLFVTNFHVVPWVAAARQQPHFQANPAEVVELLEVPLAHLSDPARQGRSQRRERGLVFSAPHYSLQRHEVWGATSMLLCELAAALAGLQL
jgi:8-oxo-dGTP pyrophosphatase MutT (NUDIX family)